jgi:hypothetical protein
MLRPVGKQQESSSYEEMVMLETPGMLQPGEATAGVFGVTRRQELTRVLRARTIWTREMDSCFAIIGGLSNGCACGAGPDDDLRRCRKDLFIGGRGHCCWTSWRFWKSFGGRSCRRMDRLKSRRVCQPLQERRWMPGLWSRVSRARWSEARRCTRRG